MEELAHRELLDPIERVAGTSVGSIAALVVSLRYPVPVVRELLTGLNFARFVSRGEPLEFTNRYGWYSMTPLIEWVQEVIRDAGPFLKKESLSGKETFAELRAAGARELVVFATDLNTRRSVRFSSQLTPDTPVAHAIAASCSIPGFFQAVKLPKGSFTSHILVDGGILNNFPIMAFDAAEGANPHTIGFKFTFAKSAPRRDLDFGMVGTWAEQLYETIKDGTAEYMRIHPEHARRTAFISNSGISVVDFKINEEQKKTLLDNGREAAARFLHRREQRATVWRRLLRWWTPE